MQAHEGIEHQQARLELRDGVFEAFAVGGLVEAHGGGGDDVHVQVFELASRGGADALEPAAHDVQGILGRVQQHPARPGDREAAQAGVPEATATARSRARKDLQHFGSPPTMPTACSDHSPVTSQRCSSG